MASHKVSGYLLERLREWGVEHLFALPSSPAGSGCAWPPPDLAPTTCLTACTTPSSTTFRSWRSSGRPTGRPWAALPAIRQARSVIGDGTELFVDANGGYTRKQAIRIMAAAAEPDVRRFEEPVSSDDLDGLREVRDAVAADVRAGEYGYDLYYFRRLCAAGAVDCLKADVSRCGGSPSGSVSRP